MKLLFILPPQIVKSPDGRVDYQPEVTIPLSCLYMASYLRSREWPGEMKVYDARTSANKLKRQPGEDRVIFGDSWKTVEETISDYKPDVVAISNLFSVQIDAALHTAKLVKKVCPNAITVLGGPHASTFPDEMIQKPCIDYVVVGEGEERLLIILEAIEKGETIESQGILGKEEDLSLLNSNKRVPVKYIADIDSVPFPAYDLVDMDRYFYLQSHGYAPHPREGGKRAMPLMTSRGCPHQCVFCSVQNTMGYRFRHHSKEYLAAHIKLMRDDYDIDYIDFWDDNLTHDLEKYDEVLDILSAQSPKLKWGTPNGVRADSWSFELLKKTKDCGVQHLNIALESSVQRVIDEVVKKRLDISRVEDVMKWCRELDIKLVALYIIGLPGETKEDIRNNIDFAIDKYERYRAYPTFSMANPLPGTELYDQVMKNKLYRDVSPKDIHKSNNPIIHTDEFDPEFVQKMYDMACKRKTWTTVKYMLTSPKWLVEYLKRSARHPWFFIKIMQAAVRAIIVQINPFSGFKPPTRQEAVNFLRVK